MVVALPWASAKESSRPPVRTVVWSQEEAGVKRAVCPVTCYCAGHLLLDWLLSTAATRARAADPRVMHNRDFVHRASRPADLVLQPRG